MMTYTDQDAYDVWAKRDALAEVVAHAIMRWSTPVNVIVSMGTFNTQVLPAEASYLQQIVALSMWGVLIVASSFVRPVLQLKFELETFAVIGFLVFAIASVLWTDLSLATMMKSAALAVTTFGAFCLITRVDVDDISKWTGLGLFILVSVSLCFSVFLPDIGVDQGWMHGGQWQGIFQSKQTLGFVSAYLLFFACYRKLTGHGWIPFLVAFSIAVICVIGSGSRGGGALGLAACAGLFVCMRSIKWMKFFAILPFALTLVASLLILYFYLTGYDALYVFGSAIDFTERTYIWQYALGHLNDAPFIGFGINGFWTVPAIYDYFEQNHGWVLDNYHSGYIAILMETGFLGCVLFAVGVFFVMVKTLDLISIRCIQRSHCALIVVFSALSFQMNFTETMFLRSTTFTSVLLVAFFLATSRPLLQQR
jgi:exopolysaccharide production protein ExoQ